MSSYDDEELVSKPGRRLRARPQSWGSEAMLTLYIMSAIVGGVLVVISAFLGDHDTGSEHEFGHDGDFQADADGGEVGHDVDHDAAWLPFFSVRFWTYLAASFGLTGVLLSWLTDTPEQTVLTWSVATGLVVGLSVSYLMYLLRRIGSDSSVAPNDMLGIEARVTVPIRPLSQGKIRCHVKGESLDVFATAEGDATFEEGDSVVIVEMNSDRARVVRREDVFG